MKLLGLLLGLVCVGMSLAAVPRASARSMERRGSTLLTLHTPSTTRVWFPSGAFTMGSTPEEVLQALTQCANEPLAARCPDFSNEQPRRTVHLSRFALDTEEVSVHAYERCVAARRCRPIPYYRGARRFERADLPAVLVTHRDAAAYCAFVGGALPTEAQFERAAGGTTRRRYPWGDTYHRQLANHGRLAFNATESSDGNLELAPVRSYPQGATPEGVLNLGGNAAEWVHDAYSPYYDEADTQNPLGPDAASGYLEKVVRGGGYLSPPVLLRSRARQSLKPETRRADIGFRCAYPSR
jgi:formylglycine-generating enzyme required for sulfatase activity